MPNSNIAIIWTTCIRVVCGLGVDLRIEPKKEICSKEDWTMC